MKSLLRDIRPYPDLLIATCCLVVLKVSGLLLEGGYILGDDMPKPKSWAQETLGFPAPGRMLDASDITGSVPKKEESRRRAFPKPFRRRQYRLSRSQSPDHVIGARCWRACRRGDRRSRRVRAKSIFAKA
jgi:hypothetical protein